MKEKLKNLGKVLSKSEQKKIKGGFQFACTGVGTYFYTGPDYCCVLNCPFVENGKCECYCVAGTMVPAPCGYA